MIDLIVVPLVDSRRYIRFTRLAENLTSPDEIPDLLNLWGMAAPDITADCGAQDFMLFDGVSKAILKSPRIHDTL
jgi:hypothetical protein